MNRGFFVAKEIGDECPLMGWSGRALAPPALEAGKGHQRQGARHVPEARECSCRGWHRYL